MPSPSGRKPIRRRTTPNPLRILSFCFPITPTARRELTPPDGTPESIVRHSGEVTSWWIPYAPAHRMADLFHRSRTYAPRRLDHAMNGKHRAADPVFFTDRSVTRRGVPGRGLETPRTRPAPARPPLGRPRPSAQHPLRTGQKTRADGAPGVPPRTPSAHRRPEATGHRPSPPACPLPVHFRTISGGKRLPDRFGLTVSTA